MKDDPNKDGFPKPKPSEPKEGDTCVDCPGDLGGSVIQGEGTGSNGNGNGNGGGFFEATGDVLTHWGNEIGKGWDGLKNEVNGNNAERRRQKREAKRLQSEMRDLWKQAESYGLEIEDDKRAIESSWGLLNDSWKDFGLASREQDLSNFRGRYNSRTRQILDGVPVADPSVFDGLGKGRGDGVYPEHQKVANGRKYLSYARGKLDPNAPDYGVRKTLVDFGDAALDEAEAAYREGKVLDGNAWHDIAIEAADAALSLTPGVGVLKDLYEASTGRRLLTGEKLTNFERTMAAVGVVTLGVGKFGVTAKAGKLFGVMAKGAKTTEEAEKIAQAGKEAIELSEAAAKAGIKDKKILDEVAEAVKDGAPCVARNSHKPSIFELFFGTAYAADCLPGTAEKALKESLNNVTKTAKQFEERIAKLPPGERVAEIKGTLAAKAKQNGWTKDRNVSKKNGRDVYADGHGDYHAVDTQHGRYEKCNSRGKHQGEFDIDGTQQKPADPSGGHDIIVR
jgi:hypothetical protein